MNKVFPDIEAVSLQATYEVNAEPIKQRTFNPSTSQSLNKFEIITSKIKNQKKLGLVLSELQALDDLQNNKPLQNGGDCGEGGADSAQDAAVANAEDESDMLVIDDDSLDDGTMHDPKLKQQMYNHQLKLIKLQEVESPLLISQIHDQIEFLNE